MILLFGLHSCIYKYKVWYVEVWVDESSITCCGFFCMERNFVVMVVCFMVYVNLVMRKRL